MVFNLFPDDSRESRAPKPLQLSSVVSMLVYLAESASDGSCLVNCNAITDCSENEMDHLFSLFQ
jgi:hypothetical protein